ncbi:MAG: glycosyltransferase family 4 protein [Actinomycetota bacterium]
MSRVDLLVPELAPRDATGSHTLLLRDLLLDMGASVRFVTQIPAAVDEPFILVDDWNDPAPTIILQHGIGSFVADAVIKRRLPIVVNYHNITPIEFVEPWTPELIAGLQWGRYQLDHLGRFATRGIAVSAYNAEEMKAAGYRDVRIAPVLWNVQPGPTIDHQPTELGDPPTILFVGRVAANKRHEDLLATFALVVERHPTARLVLVGSPASATYQRCLETYARRAGIADQVDFAGSVTDEELAHRYRTADVFLCLSDHEGFCVPVVEAMAAGVPVVAHRAAALPETIGSAGLVLGDKRPATVAAAIGRVLDDASLRHHMVAAGRRRAADFSLERGQERMRAALAGVIDA